MYEFRNFVENNKSAEGKIIVLKSTESRLDNYSYKKHPCTCAVEYYLLIFHAHMYIPAQ